MKGCHRYILLGAAPLLLACGQNDAATPGGAGGRPPGEAALPVRTESVTRGEITRYIETHARLEAESWVDVVARTQGLVQVLAAEEGDRVRAGHILVQLEKDELRLQVAAAQVARDQAESAFARTRELHERQLVSQEEFESAGNARDNAEVTLREAKLRLDYADIRAPIDGVVMVRSVDAGDMVRSNDVVFAVADLDPLRTTVRVPEKRMAQVHPGQAARITVDSVPDRVFPATVRMISPGVDPASGTVKVTLDIVPAEALRPGMFATVRIVTDRRDDALIVPKKALILETDDDDVFAVRDGRAERVSIGLGFADGDRLEVLAGLDEGDRVITVGHEGLKDGAAVRVVGDPVAAPQAATDATEATASPGGWQGRGGQ